MVSLYYSRPYDQIEPSYSRKSLTQLHGQDAFIPTMQSCQLSLVLRALAVYSGNSLAIQDGGEQETA